MENFEVCGLRRHTISWPEAVAYWSLLVAVRLPGNWWTVQQINVLIKLTQNHQFLPSTSFYAKLK